MDLHGKSGNYFRANVWSWRPIHALVEELNNDLFLLLDLTNWDSNDGAGLNSQEECDKLADAIEDHVKAGRKKYVLETGCSLRVDDDGRFLEPGAIGGKSPYFTSASHILEFVKFLRECGGSFEIN